MQAYHDCYTLEFSLEKTCDVIGSVHPVRKCSRRSKADQSQSRFGTVQVNSNHVTTGSTNGAVIVIGKFSHCVLQNPRLPPQINCSVYSVLSGSICVQAIKQTSRSYSWKYLLGQTDAVKLKKKRVQSNIA